MTFCATEVRRFSLLMVLRFTTWKLTKNKISHKNIHIFKKKTTFFTWLATGFST